MTWSQSLQGQNSYVFEANYISFFKCLILIYSFAQILNISFKKYMVYALVYVL